MNGDVVITRIGDTDLYTPGQMPVRGVQAEFMVGKFGPFRVNVEKTDTWSDDLRRKVDEEAARVRSLST